MRPTSEAGVQGLNAGAHLRDVQDVARHAAPKTTMRYGRNRHSLDRHATYAIAKYIAGEHRDGDAAARGLHGRLAALCRAWGRARAADASGTTDVPFPVVNVATHGVPALVQGVITGRRRKTAS